MHNDKRIKACISRYDNVAPMGYSMGAHAEALSNWRQQLLQQRRGWNV